MIRRISVSLLRYKVTLSFSIIMEGVAGINGFAVVPNKIKLLAGFLDGDGHINYITVSATSASAHVEQSRGIHTKLFNDIFDVADSIEGIRVTWFLLRIVGNLYHCFSCGRGNSPNRRTPFTTNSPTSTCFARESGARMCLAASRVEFSTSPQSNLTSL